MKTTILKLSAFILLFALMGAGCEKDDELLLEISPNSETAVIQKEVDGIEFKFCLLNEKGEPATVFKEGENFLFNFSFKNNTSNTIIVTTEFINQNFYRVFRSSSNTDKGKPWTGLWCQYSLSPQEITLEQSNSKELRCPWILDERNTPDYPLCMSMSKDLLNKGEYFTSFTLDFHYTSNGKTKVIKDITFKILFQIQ